MCMQWVRNKGEKRHQEAWGPLGCGRLVESGVKHARDMGCCSTIRGLIAVGLSVSSLRYLGRDLHGFLCHPVVLFLQEVETMASIPRSN